MSYLVTWTYTEIWSNSNPEVEATSITRTAIIATDASSFSFETTATNPLNKALVTTVSTALTAGPVTSNTQLDRPRESEDSSLTSAATTTQAGTSHTTATLATSSSVNGTNAAPPAGVSTGAAAGIGIGCAIAGAILAAVIVCVFMRRWRKPHVIRSPSRGASMREGRAQGHSNQMDTKLVPLHKSSTTSTIEAALPPPMQDSDIVGNLQRLGTSITNHAHSYFTTSGPSPPNAVDQVRLATLLGQHAPLQVHDLQSVLSSPRSKTAGVRFILAWSILQNSLSSSHPDTSLLPPEIAECSESMRYANVNDDTRMLLISRWRQMTASLMSPTYDRDDISSTDPRKRNIDELVIALDSVLSALSSGRNEANRKHDLENLVIRGAHLGWQLFAQPTTWSLEWENSSTRQRGGELVVLPGLLQTGDDQGRAHKIVQPFAAPQTVKIA